MLRRFYADNFRCLVNFELKPEPVQLLVGGNGSGKTAVVEAIYRLREFVVEAAPLDEKGSLLFGGSTRTRWQRVADQHFELDVDDEGGGRYAYRLVVSDEKNIAKVKRESLHLDGKLLFDFEDGEMRLYNDKQNPTPGATFHADWHRSGLAIVAPRPDNKKLTWFKGWLESLCAIQINPFAINEQSASEDDYPSRDLGNLADWYRHLVQEDMEGVSDALSDLREAIPGFKALNVKKAGAEYREVMASIDSPEGKPIEVRLDELSEGQRCLISLYLLLHTQLKPAGTLILDEPDNFIALREIQPWLMKTLDKCEDVGAQLVVTSHHPELLNQLAARGAVILSRDNAGPTRIRPFPESELPPAEVIASGIEDA